jgi:diguanylate cyclase (GGDEF)-like protein
VKAKTVKEAPTIMRRRQKSVVQVNGRVAGRGIGGGPSNAFTTRFFAPSPGCLILLLPAAFYPLLGGAPDLWLPLILVGLTGCLYLTLLEFTGVLIAANLVYLGGRWWLSDTGFDIDAAIGLLMLDVLLLYGRYTVFSRFALLAGANRRLAELAMVDNLTGAYNRHYLCEEGNRIYHSFVRGGGVFSVILMDIDDFKEINDLHGHAGGDAALVWFTDLVSSLLRAQDVAGRYGGDEFLVVLTRTDLDEAQRTAQRLRRNIARRDEGTPAACRDLRVSMGLAQVEPMDKGFTDIVARADAALYQAKRDGRDTIRARQSGARDPVVRGGVIRRQSRVAP